MIISIVQKKIIKTKNKIFCLGMETLQQLIFILNTDADDESKRIALEKLLSKKSMTK